MRIAVLIKQVPNAANIRFDPDKKTIIREGVRNEVSSFDLRAVVKAVEIARERGGEVVAVTMGPPQAAEALRDCLALGADRAIHLADRAFAGSDTLATSRALALALRPEKFDLLFCGKYSTDAETGQVGPEVAELLGIPQVTGVRRITLREDRAVVERETDEGRETIEVTLPFLLTVSEDLAPERFPKREEREAARAKPIRTLSAADLSADLSIFGLAGSPTWVKGIELLSPQRQCTFIQGATPDALADRLVGALLERGLFGTWKDAGPKAPALLPLGRPTRDDRAIWVVAEVLGGEIRRSTLELLGRASELAAKLDGEVAAAVAGYDLYRHVAVLAAHGADRVYLADAPNLAPYRTEPHADVLSRLIGEHRPHSVLFSSTAMGRDLAPRVAARLGLGLTSDCIGLEIDEQANLVQHKPAFGGNVVAPILSRTRPQMATVRPGIFQAARPDRTRRAQIVAVSADTAPARTKVLSLAPESGGEAAALDTAEIVVAFGAGIGGPENLPAVRELAAVLGAPLATTRDCADQGWLPRQHQVGLTGRAIAPRLYLAVGVRGAFEHLVGIRKAGVVAAINRDPQAGIWKGADLGVVADWKEIVPRLTRMLQSAKSTRS